jgi:hypothetical protein
MFVKQCDNTNTHDTHVHEIHWVKSEVPGLLKPEALPDEWDTRYRCPGVRVQAWTVDMLHEDCTPCEACADMAVNAATTNGTESEVWRELGPGEAINHMAEVSRL